MPGIMRACIQKMFGFLRPEPIVIFLNVLCWSWILLQVLVTMWTTTTLTIALCISIMVCHSAWRDYATFKETMEQTIKHHVETAKRAEEEKIMLQDSVETAKKAEEEKTRLQDYVEELKRTSKRKLKEKEEDIQILQDKIEKKEKEIEDLKKQLEQEQTNTENLQQQIDKSKKEIKRLKEEKVDLEGKAEGLKEILLEMDKKNGGFSMANLIRARFKQHVNPLSLIPALHKYDHEIVTADDEEEVRAIEAWKGERRAADRLLSLLCRYHGWLPCLVKALRDSEVKQTPLADYIESALGQVKEVKKRNYLNSARKNQGDHQMEFDFQSEIDERKKNGPCENEAKHDTLVEMKHFQHELLPETWRFEEFGDFLKAAGHLTVHVTSKYISDRRPQGYPLCDLGGVCGMLRIGCGMVWAIQSAFYTSDTPSCPCQKCLKDGKKEKQWEEFLMFTDRHLIYDDDETYFTTLTVSFDNGDGNINTEQLFPVICHDRGDKDYIEIKCVTHDKQVARKLETALSQYEKNREKIATKISQRSRIPEPRETMKCIILSYSNGTKKCVTVGDVKGSFPLSYKAVTPPGSSGAPVFVLGDCSNEGKYVSTSTHCTYNKASGTGQSSKWRR